MTKAHRIAAGGITFWENSVLLVRYPDGGGGTYLAGPGGALEEYENVVQTIIRETKEETGILVQPKRVILIEDLNCLQYKMSKVWMVCEYIGGEIGQTEEAKIEGIIEAAWFSKAQLKSEVVHPQVLLENNWDQLRSEKWQVECPPSRAANI